ncbi:hypothetical protein [Pseudomonas sp. GV071]|uniref:hypothetical protein n=1 Tax=Pseudomonas sp. GV071 TaxID=2135754 RepID=UPI000D38D455|nr:hypothetical protein [Pseudomonas sp. GV071]
MARIVKKPGDLLIFPLSAEGKYGCCQWLADGTARFFLSASSQDFSPSEILALPVAFRVLVFRDTPNRYGWTKVGKGAMPDEFSSPQRYAKRNPISGAISIYFEGNETRATYAEVEGLETVAVWAHPHIVERLEAQLEGRESKFLRSVQVSAV